MKENFNRKGNIFKQFFVSIRHEKWISLEISRKYNLQQTNCVIWRSYKFFVFSFYHSCIIILTQLIKTLTWCKFKERYLIVCRCKLPFELCQRWYVETDRSADEEDHWII